MATTKHKIRLPLAAQIFLVCALLITAAVAAAIAITYVQGRRIADDTVTKTLDASAAVQANAKNVQLARVQNTVQFIAQDPAVVQYFESSTDIELGLGDLAGGTVSLSDLLLERQDQYGFGLGIFLDANGNVLARTDELEAVEENLSGDPFLASAISEAIPISGPWRQEQGLHQAAIMPILRGEDLLGFLLLADPIDHEFARGISKLSGADIAFVYADGERLQIAASSLEEEANEALRVSLERDAALKRAISEAGVLERVTFHAPEGDMVGTLGPVDADGGGRLGVTLSFTSKDKAYAGFQRILNLVLFTGLGSLLAALPLSYLMARAILRPVSAMASAAEHAADGHYQSRLAIEGKDELARLSVAFDRLLSDLREKSDIEGYVSNLSRFLPEPGSERALVAPESMSAAAIPAKPLRFNNRILLGVDCRALARAVPRDQTDRLSQGVGSFAAVIHEVARRADAQILSIDGLRAVLGFAGEEPVARALRTARFLRRDSSLSDALASSIAVALHEGDLVEGEVALGDRIVPVAAGSALYQLGRLMAEASEGALVVAKPMIEQVKITTGSEIKAMAGMVSGRAFPALDLPTLDHLEPLANKGAPGTAEDYSTVVTPSAPQASTRRTQQAGVAPGAIFAGRYEILSELGAGGMGVVYKARDLELDDVVAIKMLRGAATMDQEQLDRLKSELKLARKITHPNVLRTFDFGDSEGRPYISMEYVRGMTLRYLLKQAGRIPYSAALRIAKQLCAGLAAAHEVGVLHRDIKPENLILEASGNAKLMDFGIARPIRRSEPGYTQPGMFVGTPHYSAPEQLAGDDVDHRADVYASGVLLCEMFCGKLPFTGSNTMEIYMAQMQQAPIKPSDYWPEIPEELEGLILRCIARRAEDRFQQVSDLGQALAQLRV